MRSYPNIDKSGFRRGEYVAYSDLGLWRVRRVGQQWQAVCRDVLCASISAPTLAMVSARVAACVAPKPVAGA